MRLRYFLIFAISFCSSLIAMAQVASVTSEGQTTNYNTLADAIAEVNKLSTTPVVKLLADDENIQKTIELTSSAVLDLNGHKVTACEPETLMVVSGASTTLTVKDSGKGGMLLHYDGIDTYNNSVYGVIVKDKATLNLESGALMMSSRIDDEGDIYFSDFTEKLTCVFVGEGSAMNIIGGEIVVDAKTQAYGVYAEGTVNISGGKLDAKALGQIYACYIKGTAARLNMTGGEINANREILTSKEDETYRNTYRVAVNVSSGVAVIDGGNLSATSRTYGYAVSGGSKSDITINGGAFKTINALNANYNVSTSGKLVINGGMFNSHYYLQNYAKGKYLNPIFSNDTRYKEGYYCYVSAAKDDYGVARNLTKNLSYATLEEAIASAVKGDTVSLMKDYTLAQSLTVPSGVMLLVPCDETNRCFTTQAEGLYPCSITPKPYYTLNIADNVALTVDGELSVSARVFAAGGGQKQGCGAAADTYGAIKLGKDSKLNVSGALYCWGFIYGDGIVTMNKGAKLYEVFDLLDWRGGNRTSEFYTKMYPLMQYQVQNVESKLVLMPGAQSFAGTAMEVTSLVYYLKPIPFVGPVDAFMTTGNSTIVTRQYDAQKDRMTYDFDGDVTMGGMFLDFGEGLDINSKEFRAHLVDNWTLNQNSGTLTFPYSYNLLPGTQLNIAEGAKVLVTSKGSLNLIDKDEWGMNTFNGYINPATFTIANGMNNKSVRCGTNDGLKSQFAIDHMTDAKIDVRGTLQVDGALTTTKGGANIISSLTTQSEENGIVTFGKATTEKAKADSIYFVTLGAYNADSCPIYYAPLVNADNTTVNTVNSKAGTTFRYSGEAWVKYDPTGADYIEGTTDDTAKASLYYDLMGRKVSRMEPNRLYIVGGRKYFNRK